VMAVFGAPRRMATTLSDASGLHSTSGAACLGRGRARSPYWRAHRHCQWRGYGSGTGSSRPP
jgi:hypothetical protein